MTSRKLTGIVVGIWTLDVVIVAGIATGMVWPLGSCKSTGKVPDTGLRREGGGNKVRKTDNFVIKNTQNRICHKFKTRVATDLQTYIKSYSSNN